jgi:hypothetical protein
MLGVPIKKCGAHSWNYVKPVCYILITMYLAGILRRSLQSGTEHTCLIRTPVLTLSSFLTLQYIFRIIGPTCHASWVVSITVHERS